jgi:hypothetical protein
MYARQAYTCDAGLGEQGWAHTTNTLYKLGSRLEAFGFEVHTPLYVLGCLRVLKSNTLPSAHRQSLKVSASFYILDCCGELV